MCKVCIDVGCYEPVYDVLYITLQALLRGELFKRTGLKTIRSEISKVPRIWAMSPRYWGLVDFVNFAYVDLRLRPLYNACFSTFFAPPARIANLARPSHMHGHSSRAEVSQTQGPKILSIGFSNPLDHDLRILQNPRRLR